MVALARFTEPPSVTLPWNWTCCPFLAFTAPAPGPVNDVTWRLVAVGVPADTGTALSMVKRGVTIAALLLPTPSTAVTATDWPAQTLPDPEQSLLTFQK